MAHDVFISHSTNNRLVANAVCASLESVAIRCWIAPRDVMPGRSYSGEITRAIQQSRAFVLIFSEHSNNSEQVLREVQLAANSHLHIVQFRIAAVVPSDDLEYYLSGPHWLDAVTPPLENHLAQLQTSIKALLALPRAEETEKTAPPEAHRAVSVEPLSEPRTARSTITTARAPVVAKSSTNVWKMGGSCRRGCDNVWRRRVVLDLQPSAIQAGGPDRSAFAEHSAGNGAGSSGSAKPEYGVPSRYPIIDRGTTYEHECDRQCRRGGTLCEGILPRDGTGRCEQGRIVPR